MKVKVRVRGIMNHEGKWAVYGWNDASADDADSVLHDMMADHPIDTARSFWLTAEIELPQEMEIDAAVEVDIPHQGIVR